MKEWGELMVHLITIFLTGWTAATGILLSAKMFGLI